MLLLIAEVGRVDGCSFVTPLSGCMGVSACSVFERRYRSDEQQAVAFEDDDVGEVGAGAGGVEHGLGTVGPRFVGECPGGRGLAPGVAVLPDDGGIPVAAPVGDAGGFEAHRYEDPACAIAEITPDGDGSTLRRKGCVGGELARMVKAAEGSACRFTGRAGEIFGQNTPDRTAEGCKDQGSVFRYRWGTCHTGRLPEYGGPRQQPGSMSCQDLRLRRKGHRRAPAFLACICWT